MGLHFFEGLVKANETSLVSSSHEFSVLILLMGNSLLVGFYLSVVTYFLNLTLLQKKSNNFQRKKAKLLMGISNILYLCTGLTGLMILVNNNLARAFSIGAAIALVRFRIKLGQKSADSNILFAIACGIATGLNEVAMSWILAIVYTLISSILSFLTGRSISKPSDSE